MPNTLTNLAADIYTAADKVGRELVGIVPSATINFHQAGQTVAKAELSARTSHTPVVNTTYAPSMTVQRVPIKQ